MFDGSGDDKPHRQPGRGPAHLKGSRSLERLRDRIELAVKELHRLRQDNADLQKQLDSFRSQGLETFEGTVVTFADSPSALRTKVETCIDAIDRYLEGSDDQAVTEDAQDVE